MPRTTLTPVPRQAPVEEHRKHALAFLAIEDFKDPRKVNRPDYRDATEMPSEEPPEDRPAGNPPNRRVVL
jgi:hypothetical protein